MVMSTNETCPHCKRYADTQFEVLWNDGTELHSLGPCCQDCMEILKFHVKQLAHINQAKLN